MEGALREFLETPTGQTISVLIVVVVGFWLRGKVADTRRHNCWKTRQEQTAGKKATTRV